jgi:hypothetical protein
MLRDWPVALPTHRVRGLTGSRTTGLQEVAVLTGDPSFPFAGDLFLRLAAEKRLRLDAAQADDIIASLAETLAVVHARLRLLRVWQAPHDGDLTDLSDEAARDVFHVMFLDQVRPGQLEQAADEIPKYIEALRRARVT